MGYGGCKGVCYFSRLFYCRIVDLEVTDRSSVCFPADASNARLTRLLQFYTRSRDVTDFVSLCQLLIVDRVKVSLTESALKHVISVESTATDPWLRPDVLSDVLDNYYANYQFNDKPRVSAIGTNQSLPYTSFSKMKTGQINESLRPHSVKDSSHVDKIGQENVKPRKKGQDPTGEQGFVCLFVCLMLNGTSAPVGPLVPR